MLRCFARMDRYGHRLHDLTPRRLLLMRLLSPHEAHAHLLWLRRDSPLDPIGCTLGHNSPYARSSRSRECPRDLQIGPRVAGCGLCVTSGVPFGEVVVANYLVGVDHWGVRVADCREIVLPDSQVRRWPAFIYYEIPRIPRTQNLLIGLSIMVQIEIIASISNFMQNLRRRLIKLRALAGLDQRQRVVVATLVHPHSGPRVAWLHLPDIRNRAAFKWLLIMKCTGIPVLVGTWQWIECRQHQLIVTIASGTECSSIGIGRPALVQLIQLVMTVFFKKGTTLPHTSLCVLLDHYFQGRIPAAPHLDLLARIEDPARHRRFRRLQILAVLLLHRTIPSPCKQSVPSLFRIHF